MITRNELVTTALLGTDRRGPRPVEGAEEPERAEHRDPAAAFLDESARSAVAHRSGAQLASAALIDRGPTDRVPLAPEPAQLVLGRLLTRPVVELVNLWLAAAAQRGLGAAPQHWTPLVSLAARSAGVDRVLLGRVLGPRGRWFLTRNTAWTRLAAAVAAPPDVVTPGARAGPERIIDPPAVLRDPDLIFERPDPWPRELVETVLEILASGVLLRRGPAYAAAAGLRIPLDHAALVGPYAEAPEGRLVRDAFVALDRTVSSRAEIERAFAPQPQESP